MGRFENVYKITNENLNAYKDIYDFDKAKVLTVLGSGDQYFTSLLNGADVVDTFDINFLAWYYFILKFTAIKVLSYEDFYEFFIRSNLTNTSIYLKIIEYLPPRVLSFFDELVCTGSIEDVVYAAMLYKGPEYNDGSIIPYFAINEYYRLQEIIKKRDLPRFYNVNLANLNNEINTTYDLMLFSNIYLYLPHTPAEFKAMLDKFKTDTIQAHYMWNQNSFVSEFIEQGFDASLVLPVNPSAKVTNNIVLTYKRTK
jgi:hypothetical protein